MVKPAAGRRPQRSSTKPPARFQAFRKLAVAGLIGAALLSGSAAISASIGRRLPEVAVNLWPVSGNVLAELSSKHLLAATGPQGRSIPNNIPRAVGDNAYQALLREPFNAEALRNYAYGLDAEGEREKARMVMASAYRLTRRNVGTNLWLIEDLARRGQDAQALAIYDVAIRTNSRAATLLINAMSQAVDDPRLRGSLVSVLASNPPWLSQFWTVVLSSDRDLDNVYDLRAQLHDRGGSTLLLEHDALLVSRLANAGRYDEAFKLYEAAASDTEPQQAGGAFLQAAQFPPIGWKVGTGDGFGAKIDRRTGNLAIIALRGAQGVVAQKLVKTAGLSGLAFQARYKDPGKASTMQIEAQCAQPSSDDSLIAHVRLAQGDRQTASLRRPCAFAWVSLVLAPDAISNDTEIELERLDIQPAR